MLINDQKALYKRVELLSTYTLRGFGRFDREVDIFPAQLHVLKIIASTRRTCAWRTRIKLSSSLYHFRPISHQVRVRGPRLPSRCRLPFQLQSTRQRAPYNSLPVLRSTGMIWTALRSRVNSYVDIETPTPFLRSRVQSRLDELSTGK